jgi:ribosome-associated protein
MPESTPASDKTIIIRAEPIELCQLLKFSGLTESGGAAKQAISDGLVSLNGTVETQKRKKVMAGDRVTYNGTTLLVSVGR